MKMVVVPLEDLPSTDRCRVCGGPCRDLLAIETQHRDVRRLVVVRCETCGSLTYAGEEPVIGYTDPEFQAAFWKHYAQVGAGISAMLTPLHSIEKRGALLDVGCGFGFVPDFWRRMDYGPAEGMEVALYGAVGREKLGVTLHHGLLGKCPAVDGRTFDLVYSSEVIEHTRAPLDFVKALGSVLAPDGVLVLTTPSVEAVSNPASDADRIAALSPFFHYLIFSASALDALVRKAGFPHVRVLDSGGRLCLWASRVPLPPIEHERIHFSDYLDYLELLSENTDPHVCGGALYRLFKDAWNTGNRQRGYLAFQRLERFAKDSYGIDLRKPDLAGPLARESYLSDTERCPCWLGCALYFGSLIVREMEADRATSLEMLAAAECILAVEAASQAFEQFAQEASHYYPMAREELSRALGGRPKESPHTFLAGA